MTRSLGATVLLLAGLLASCESPPPDAYVATAEKRADVAVPVGANEVGEPCRYQLAPSIAGGRRDAVIYCGNWQQPSGRVSELAEAADPARLNDVIAHGAWRTYVDQRFACGAPVQTRILDGLPAVLMQCSRRVGGWPHLALTATVDGRVFAADAVRPALPAIEATIAALSGRGTPRAAAAGSSEAGRLIAQRAGGAAFGSGDTGRYFEELRLGDAYNNVDNPVEAERAYREAIAVQQKALGPNDPGLALATMKLAAQVAHQGNRNEADRLLARSTALIAQRPDPLLSAQLDFYRATVAAYDGQTDPAMSWVRRAEAGFARLVPQATDAFRESGTGGGRGGQVLSRFDVQTLIGEESNTNPEERAAGLGLAEAMRLHATLLQLTGKTAEARQVARGAQMLLARTGLSVSSTAARGLRLIATNEAIGGDYSVAAGTSGEAGRIFERVTPGERPAAANLLDQGYYLLQSNRVDAALERFRRAGEILRSPMVGGAVSPNAVLPWLDALERAAGGGARSAAEMFEAAQFARTGQTAQDIARATAALTADDPRAAEMARSFEGLRDQVGRLERERIIAEQEKATADRLAALDRQLEEAALAQREAEAAIIAAAPRVQQAAEKPVPAAELQRMLAADEAVAFVFVADGGSYGFFVRPDGLTAYKIPLTRARIAELIAKLIDSTIEKPGGLPTPDFAASYELYSALFGPVEQQFAGVNRLTVAAAGDLIRYPLEALATEPGAKPDGQDYRQVPFLVKRVAIAYVPAPRILANIRSTRAPAGLRPFIGFGDFRPASAGQLMAAFPPDRCGDDYRYLATLAPLPETRTQVVAIGRQLGAGPGDLVLGEEFTRDRFDRPDLAQYRNVLLATHAFFPSGRLRCMNSPAIAVSAPARAPTAAAAFLHPEFIERLKLNSDLVVLSACNTSGAQNGESLAGLARAFFVAGSRGLLLTHWDVVVGASVPLMTETFNAGGGSTNSAQALRAAKLRLIASAGSSAAFPVEISHPNYWSAFVLFGDGVRAGPGA